MRECKNEHQQEYPDGTEWNLNNTLQLPPAMHTNKCAY